MTTKRIEKQRNLITTFITIGMVMFVVALTAGFFSQMNTTTFVLFLISIGLCLISLCSAYYLTNKISNMESEYCKDARESLLKELNK